jgi:hypothetical protein
MSMMVWDVMMCGLDRKITFRRHILPPSAELKMWTVCFFEMLVSAYKSTQRDKPEEQQ